MAPLMVLIAAAIRLDTRGRVLFCQTRVGKDGRHFRMFKFRSMTADQAQRRRFETATRRVGCSRSPTTRA